MVVLRKKERKGNERTRMKKKKEREGSIDKNTQFKLKKKRS